MLRWLLPAASMLVAGPAVADARLGTTHAASPVDVGLTVDGGTHYPDHRADFFVGRDTALRTQGSGPRAPYYLLRGARWTSRIAFRVAVGRLRVVDTRDAHFREYALPAPCIPRDLTAADVLLGCPSGTDIRLIHLATGAVTPVPSTAGPPTRDFWALALGRHWILGEACGFDIVPDFSDCRYEYIRRRDGRGRLSGRLLDVDTRGLKRRAAATAHPPFVAPTLSDTTRTLVRRDRRRRTIRCSGSCLDVQLVGRWATWRDDQGIGILDTKTGRRRRIKPPAGTVLLDLQQRPGRKLVAVEGAPEGSDHVIVIGF